MKQLKWMVIAAVMFSLFGAAFAQQMQRGQRGAARTPSGSEILQRVQASRLADFAIKNSKEVGLSDGAVQKLETLKSDAKKKMEAVRGEVKKLQSKKQNLMSKDNVDKQKVFSVIDQMADKQADLEKARVEEKMKLNEILSDKQRENLKNVLMKKVRQRRQQQQQRQMPRRPSRGR